MKVIGTLAAALFCSTALFAQTEGNALDSLSLEDLLNIEIISASNKAEKLLEAPATVIVLTRKEISQRGYAELSQILNDLPGMDVPRAYGDNYFKLFWRGYRNTVGSPCLLMIDGIVYNHLYTNDVENLPVLPISNIERVEIVYGPASSVYGTNAFMGVINVITVKGKATDGSSARGILTYGSFATRIADVNVLYKKGDFRLSVTGRSEYGIIDLKAADRFEWTKSKYLRDPRIWGDFVNNPALAGDSTSPHTFNAVDVRAYLGNTEFGGYYHSRKTGYGFVYAADRLHRAALWDRVESDLHIRHTQQLGDKATSTTLLRYRTSGIDNDSYDLEGAVDAQKRPVVQLIYWQAANESVSLYQDFTYTPLQKFSLNAGIKWERKDLQKSYDLIAGPLMLASDIKKVSAYPLPAPAPDVNRAANRTVTHDIGAYVQGKYDVSSLLGEQGIQNLIFGARADNNSAYNDAITIRAGYVGQFDKFTAKLLYGEAYQEPTPRQLYGGWSGSGSDPNLKPEYSNTLEASAGYNTKTIGAIASLYSVNNRNTIVTVAGSAQNLGKRTVSGIDVHLNAIIPQTVFQQLKAWAYFSHIFKASEEVTDTVKALVTTTDIGDLAKDKFFFGVTATATQDIFLTLRGRYIGTRQNEPTNPIRETEAYSTVDFTAVWKNIVPGFGVTLAVTNLFDAAYFHPGLRGATSGNTPGAFTGDAWSRSGGTYNSQLPQFGRGVFLSLTLDME